MTCHTPAKRTRARSWDVFERRFRIRSLDEDNTPLWELSEVRPPDRTDDRYWWTVLDCANGFYLAAGFHFVNRLCYVRCEVPWSDADALIDYHYD
ncbi:MAG: hypothetical protein ACLPPF_18890 [Rhodomicrobium sp.]